MSDVTSTKRKTMVHLQDMKPAEFIELAKNIKHQLKGKLKGLPVALKVDGLGARFGVTKSGVKFFEGSRTGPIFTPKAFSSFAAGRGEQDPVKLERASHYDDIYDHLMKSKVLNHLPDDTKVVCEIFYNPMGDVEEDGITFVTVKYDKTKLGKLMTIVPHAVLVASSGEPHPESAAIIKKLLSQSTNDIKIITADLRMGTIDVSGIIDPIDSINPEIAKSLKHADKQAKANALAVIQGIKNQLAEYILDHPAIAGKGMLGPEIEGLVLTLNNTNYKITTQKFKDSKK